MGYNESYRALSEKIQRVIAAVDLAEIPSDDIDAFLEAVVPEPFDDAKVRRLCRKASAELVAPRAENPGKETEGPKAGGRARSCRLSCEQLEDRLPPSTFMFSLGERSYETGQGPAVEMSAPNVGTVEAGRVVRPSGMDIQIGEMPAVAGGENGLAAATEPHTALSAASFSSVFARKDYQQGAGFEGPGTPDSDLQEVLAWNLLASHGAPGSLDILSLQMAS